MIENTPKVPVYEMKARLDERRLRRAHRSEPHLDSFSLRSLS